MARREPARGSWFGALLGLLVLAVGAFVVGALAGLVWKDPALLVAYLRGDTSEVAWSSDADTPGTPSPVAAAVAAPQPGAGAPSPAAAEPGAGAPAPAPAAMASHETTRTAAPARPPAVSSAPPARPSAVEAKPPARIAVQVGAFSERSSADRLRRRLADAGFSAYLAPAASGSHWRVRVGPFDSRQQAEQVAGRLERDQKLPTWVLDEDAE